MSILLAPPEISLKHRRKKVGSGWVDLLKVKWPFYEKLIFSQ